MVPRLRDAHRPLALVVDDDPTIRALCAANLRLAGFDVLEAEDGADGLEQARSVRPDVVLSDVRMPRLDGFGLAQALRRDARTRRIPVVFLSGEVGTATRARASALGASGFVAKPFDPIAIPPLLRALVDHAGG
jgi:two-component system chemotaxis response regulator CheY